MRRKEPELGQLAQTFKALMQQRDAMREAGASREDMDAAMEKTLRAAWPQTREWHYVCAGCNDLGWTVKTCVSGSCGRPFRLPGQGGDDWTGRGRCTEGHTYSMPCYCEKGRQLKRGLTKERTVEDEVAIAAKAAKPSRFGR